MNDLPCCMGETKTSKTPELKSQVQMVTANPLTIQMQNGTNE